MNIIKCALQAGGIGILVLSMAIHFVPKQARWPLFSIAFLKCSEHNYPLDQVLEIFKYSFYFDGITLKKLFFFVSLQLT